MSQVRDDRADRLGGHQGEQVAEHVLGHAGGRDGRDRVRLDATACTLEGQDSGEPRESRLGRTVVRLTEVPEQTGSRGGTDDSPVALLAHDGERRPGDVQGALQVDVDHRVDRVVIHLVECLVSQDPGVVDQDIDPAEGVHGGVDDGASPCRRGHAVAVGDRGAAEC